MNVSETPHPAELCLHRTLERAEDYVRREPTKAVGAALGAGLVLTLLTARSMVRPIAALGAAMVSPTLLGLGLIKAFELCCQTIPAKEETPSVDSP